MKDASLLVEFTRRVERFQRLLKESDFDGAILVQSTDLYYLIGTDQSGLLWVPAKGKPLFMVRKSYERALQDGVVENIVIVE